MVTLTSIALSFEGQGSFDFNIGSLYVLGVAFGMILLGERPGLQFYAGLFIMIIATVLMVKDTISLQNGIVNYLVRL